MYTYQLSEFKRVQSEKPILAAHQWLDVDGQYIILMLHPDNEYTMEVAHTVDHDSLVDKHLESIQHWYKIEKARIDKMLDV